MGLALNNFQMEISIGDNTKKENLMDVDVTVGLMGHAIKGIFKKGFDKD